MCLDLLSETPDGVKYLFVLTKQQCKWDASRLESRALVFDLQTFHWVLSPQFKDGLVTDHHALRLLRDCAKDETQTPRYRQRMRFDFQIELSGP